MGKGERDLIFNAQRQTDRERQTEQRERDLMFNT